MILQSILASVILVSTPAQSDGGGNQLVPLWRFEDYRAFHTREHELIAEAIAAAKVADSLRMDHLNELRDEVKEDRDQFAQNTRVDDLIRRVNELEKAQAAAASVNYYIIAAFGVAMVLVQIFFKFFFPTIKP